ncbi:MAG: acyl-CoA dehydrogenase [Desulfosalsimonas sp.]|uniref:acyl-CoA dehydrogenase n=1 Tax=Desulfosalsimonas sp. TaxID=3073848 RepID=UPI003970AB82
MAQLIADRKDVDFVLHEQMQVTELAKNEKFAEFNKKTVDMVVTEARNLAVKAILPTQKESDEVGCSLEKDGTVKVPESFHQVNALYNEGEWLGMIDEPDYGGQGMPKTLSLAAEEYFIGANPAFMLYHGLSHGAANLIKTFGTEAQKNAYLPKIYSGKWSGTMLLTEAEAGSDVGALQTTATPNGDGTYSISGTKIFISGGEQNMVENIAHPVLARIEGAPAGTRGISLFLVPKYRVNDDGSLGEFNDVVCTGIEEKMGLHGNATCTLTLGGRGNCVGTLLGQENKGMRAMFLMMNEARQLVGLQGFATATASYIYAVNYARQRIQGKHLTAGKAADASSVPIIQHPDVRRQLLTMKAYVEGMRSLIYYGGLTHDLEGLAQSDEEKEKYADRTAILTPIIKGYITDRALEVTSHGIQVYGGYGYIQEYPMEQLMRDCRIFQIYEGTNGIQAMDLLGRKLGMKKGQPFMDYLGEMEKTIAEAGKISVLGDVTRRVENAVNRLSEVAVSLAKASVSDNILNAYAYAHPFLDVTGDVTFAWMHLWRAVLAARKLEKLTGEADMAKFMEKAGKNKDAAFYVGSLKTAEFFATNILPATMGKLDAIADVNGAAVEMPDASFGG